MDLKIKDTHYDSVAGIVGKNVVLVEVQLGWSWGAAVSVLIPRNTITGYIF